MHLEALASCANAKPIIISNPTVSKAQVSARRESVWGYRLLRTWIISTVAVCFCNVWCVDIRY